MVAEEEWRTPPGHEGYEVSTHGRVRTYRDCAGHWTGQPRLMSPLRNGDGYFIRLGRQHHYGLHTLVLLTFVGPRPDGMECRHLDGDPSNNHRDNLCWGTKQENFADRWRHGTAGGVHTNHKLTDDIVRKMRLFSGTTKELAAAFNVSLPTAYRVRTRRSWVHVL